MTKTAALVRQIESSLDRGLVGLPYAELEHPELAEREVKEPTIDKTPYSAEIESALSFFDEVRDSDLAKQGTKDFAFGMAKANVLPLHLQNMRELSADQFSSETQI